MKYWRLGWLDIKWFGMIFQRANRRGPKDPSVEHGPFLIGLRVCGKESGSSVDWLSQFSINLHVSAALLSHFTIGEKENLPHCALTRCTTHFHDIILATAGLPRSLFILSM
jgi:hypothetical protein